MRLRSARRGSALDPAGKAYSVFQNQWGAIQGKLGGPGPIQNFGWVGHNAFGLTSNWPVYSLILFVNLLKLVLPDVRF